jgi:DNA-binding XRE family transcriptional regulator
VRNKTTTGPDLAGLDPYEAFVYGQRTFQANAIELLTNHGQLDAATLVNNLEWEHGPMPLGVRIKRLRREQGLSQRALAHAANVCSTTLCNLESGERNNASARIMLRIAQALGTTVERLLSESPDGV